MVRGTLLISLAWATLLLSSAEGAASETPRARLNRPNILLIVADDLGFSDLGCYGGEIETPSLDRLASSGLRLTQFYNTSRCCPSRASLLTGQYPHRVGLGHMTRDLGQPGYRGRLSRDAVTIAQMLGTAGYRSFLSGKWHLGTADPTRHGFEEFYGTLVSARTFWDPDHYARLPEGRPARQYARGEFYGTDALTDHALDFLALARQTPERPWFLYLAYNAPHFPLHAPAETIAKYADRYRRGWDVLRAERLERMKRLGIVPPQTRLTPRSVYFDWDASEPKINPAWDSLSEERQADLARRMAIYAAMVDRIDQNIARVLDDLERHGESNETLIVFTSDNGACAEWDPHGFDIKSGPQNILHQGAELERMGLAGTFHSVGSGWANASNTPWRLYKHYAHEGGIASPCIVSWPALPDRRGAIDETPAHLIDLVPTFLEAAGIDSHGPVEGREMPAPAGKGLLPLLRGEPMEARLLFFEHEGHRAVRDGRWKLVALRDGPWELYEMVEDRTEMHDVAADHPERVRRLAAAWEQWAAAQHVTPLPTDYGVEYVRPLTTNPADP